MLLSTFVFGMGHVFFESQNIKRNMLREYGEMLEIDYSMFFHLPAVFIVR